MTEKVLPYDRSIVWQETGWWCGPAATQVVLDGKGIRVAEPTLAAEIGTHRGGTDHIGLIERVLDARVPHANYTSVLMPNDPPTRAQKDALWRHLVQSIDTGWGVVMNWVAPPSNKPRGVKGSVSPRYSSGTTYHYVAAMGYDDAGARAVWIADSGFQPQGYWVSFDQCASLIPPKGYAYANAQPGQNAADPLPRDEGAARVLSAAMGGRLSLERYTQLLPAVTASLEACDCTTLERIAMWCAQIGHESGGLYYTEEIASGADYEGRADLGNTQPGDGIRFKGRSWIQITGRHNYRELSSWAHGKGLTPTPTFFVDNPTELASDKYAGLGAAWYWVVARPDINALSDRKDLETVTRRINGGTHGLADRRTRYNRCLELGNQLLELTNTGGLTMADANNILKELWNENDSIKVYDGAGKNDGFAWAQLPDAGWKAWDLRGWLKHLTWDLLRFQRPADFKTGDTSKKWGMRDSITRIHYLTEQNNELLRRLAQSAGVDITDL